jgi:hypothetical protein
VAGDFRDLLPHVPLAPAAAQLAERLGVARHLLDEGRKAEHQSSQTF